MPSTNPNTVISILSWLKGAVSNALKPLSLKTSKKTVFIAGGGEMATARESVKIQKC